jgi:hypothetical protein
MYYTINDYSNIIVPIEYKLPNEVLVSINELDTLQFAIQQRVVNHSQSFNKSKQTGNYNKKSYQQQPQQTYHKKVNSFAIKDTDKQWDKIEKLKIITIKKKEGVEKIINDIRALLNKLTDKNYELLFATIIENIELCKTPTKITDNNDSDDSDDDDEPINKINDTSIDDLKLIANSIFDIITQNQGLFKNYKLLDIYTDLYIMLQNKYPDVFNNLLNNFFDKFKNTIEEIVYYDPNTQYDEYCNYNKLNEIRKSNTSFIVLLFNKGILHIDNICDILQYFQNKFDEYLNLPDKTNELEQIAENIFILITKSYLQLKTHPLWLNDILIKTTNISKEKAKVNYLSLTAKIIFKYKDIIDFINKV